MSVAASGGAKTVDAVITDDVGSVVAERTLTDRSARVCLPLARAVGAWASLVLDAEMNRAKDGEPGSRTSRTLAETGSTSARAPISASASPREVADLGDVRDEQPVAPTASRSIELGTMVYIRNGLTTDGGVAGLSPYMTVELTPSWVLRPALYFGRSTESVAGGSEPDGSRAVSHVGGRTDLCRRIPGNYTERRGVEADLCGGLEGGVVVPSLGANHQPVRIGFGPSLNMRGELGGGVALELRGLVGMNVLQYASLDTPLVFAAAELGVSVRFK